MNPLTYFIGKQHKKKNGCGLWEKLGQIRFNVVKKVKKLALSIFFLYFALGIPMIKKQKVVVVRTPEWKFKASIARNST